MTSSDTTSGSRRGEESSTIESASTNRNKYPNLPDPSQLAHPRQSGPFSRVRETLENAKALVLQTGAAAELEREQTDIFANTLKISITTSDEAKLQNFRRILR